MPMNRIQFQHGMSLAAFQRCYGTEAQCEAALFEARWPRGFVCPQCASPWHSNFERAGQRLWQCARCRAQSSLTAGTVFAATKLPLTVWFLAMYLLTQAKNSISALELKRQLGVCYRSAWLIKHKLMQAMARREATRRLEAVVQLDDAFLGGERTGGKRGRGSENKVPFVAAVQTSEGRPLFVRFDVLPDWRTETVTGWARRALAPSTHVVSDGLSSFVGVQQAGCMSRSHMAPASKARSTPVSSGSTPCWATSSDRWPGPTMPSKPQSTGNATSPSSNTGSTTASICPR